MNKKKVDCLLIAFSGLDLPAAQSLLKEEKCNITLQPFFNSAVTYLGSYLDARGISFDYIYSYEDQMELLEEKLNQDVAIVAISTTFLQEVGQIIQLVKRVRTLNDHCKIVVGGTFIAYTIDQYLDTERQVLMRGIGADYFVYSYFGEKSLAALLVATRAGDEDAIQQVANLYIRKGVRYEYTYQADEKTLLMENMVDWSLFSKDINLYVPVRTAISCAYRCSYCSFPKYGGKYQTVDLEGIERELSVLNAQGNVGIVHFVDDCFNKPVRRFKDILRMLIKNRFSFKWHSFLRCEDIDDETIALMQESGCLGVLIGLESGCPDMLERMNKRIDLEKTKRIIGKLNRVGIFTYALFIIGFPGETVESVKQTIAFIEECQPMYYALSPWYCNINAPIYKEKERYGIKGRNYEWSHNTMDFIMARDLALDMYFKITKSTMLSINYTFAFQLLYHGVPFEQIKQIVERGNQHLVVENDFQQRRKRYIP